MQRREYIPALPGQEYDPMEIYEDRKKVASVFRFLLSNVQLQTLHAAPERKYDGLVVKADGTDWNPGSGAGVYVYDEATTSWIKL